MNGSHSNLLPQPIWNYTYIVEKIPRTNNCTIIRKKSYKLKQTEKSASAQPGRACTTSYMVGGVTLSQPARGKDPPKNNTTIIKTQLHPGSKHKQHTKCNKFRTSRRLHH